MSSPATPAKNAGELFQALVKHLGADAVAQLKGTLKNAAANIKNNPTTLEIMGQGIALQGALIAIGPALQSDAIKQGGATLEQLIDLIPDSPLADTSSDTPVAETPAASASS